MTLDEQRLDRIEQKLDKLTEAIQGIVRVEEKLASTIGRIERFEYRLDMQESDIDKIKEIVIANTGSVKFTERLFWIAVSGVTSLVVYLLQW